MTSEWGCGCGWVNGCNLATCARCGRPPSEHGAALHDPGVEPLGRIADELHEIRVELTMLRMNGVGGED